MPREIRLADYASKGARVFAGRDRGEAVRTAVNLAEADDKGELFQIVVPDDVLSINSSFFLGMFGDSIRRLGEREFRKRYEFVGPDITRVVTDSIREALRVSSPL